jgi:hypothetical protein
MSAIEHCRTATLGGHVEACEDCGHWRIAYNSSRGLELPTFPSAWALSRPSPMQSFAPRFTNPPHPGHSADPAILQ